MKKLALLLAVFACALTGLAQDFSNKGKDFWLGYGNHVRMFNAGNAEKMQIYVTSDVATTGTVTISSIGFSQPFSVTPNQITTIDIPRTAALLDEGLYNHGIRVTALKPVVVYSFIYVNAISGATVCLPTNTLSKDYYSVNYTQVSNEANSFSYFFVVATEDNTTVEITPTATTKGGRPAGVPFTQALNRGQIFQVLASSDLTGSTIKSISTGAGGCKKIAVFCGSGKISIGCAGAGSSDNLYQQMYPTVTWGKKYITVPGLVNVNNFFRIVVSDPTAVVTVNGVVQPAASLIAGRYYQLNSAAVNVIEADKPILVAQYFTTQGCNGNPGFNAATGQPGSDPDMIYLNPVEQTISDVTLNSMKPPGVPDPTNISVHHLNVVIKNTPAAINSFRIDNVPYTAFTPVPNDPGYAYARIATTQGAHNVRSDSGFNIIAYGFGNAESYGYSGGTNLRDLYQFVTVQNQYATVNFPAGCKSSPFFFFITFPYQPNQIQWIFNGLFPDVTQTNPVSDSSWVVNGRTLYRYKLPTQYVINTPGTYPIKVIAQNPTPDGCNGVQEIDYDLQIFDPPVADFSFTHSGCLTDTLYFTENSTNTGGRPVVKWHWNFDDGVTDSIKYPKHRYAIAQTYNVKLAVITDVGCFSDTLVRPIAITTRPLAKFGISSPRCPGKVVTFTDSSTIAVGNIARWYWDFGDNTNALVTSNAAQNHTYASPGVYKVKLYVESSTNCRSLTDSVLVTIHPNPVVRFIGGNACLPVGLMQFTDQSTIADGSQAGFSYAWTFGDPNAGPGNPNTAAVANPTHNYTATGTYNVNLAVTSNNGCTRDTTIAINTIFPRPDADFSSNPEVCLSDSLQLNDLSSGAGSNITNWFWDFGDGTTSTLQSPKKKWNTAGTYTVTLYIRTDKGCISDTASKPVTVNRLPTANFTASLTRCEKTTITFTDASVPNSGNITNWKWDFGDAVIVNAASNAAQNHVYAAAGNYTATLEVTTDKGCKSAVFSLPLTVNPKPVVDFSLPVVCLPVGAAQFNDLSTISDGSQASFTHAWTFGDGGTSIVKNPLHNYGSTGPFNVKLEVTSNNGCKADSTKQLTTVYPEPRAFFKSAPEICLGATYSFTDSSYTINGVTITEWAWNFGDGGTSAAQNPTHLYAAAGTYTVTLRVKTNTGCFSNIFTKPVTVNPLPTAMFNASVPTCATRAVTFTDISVPNAGNLVKWEWDLADGTLPVNNNNNPFTHTYNTAGTYAVKLIVETDKGCRSPQLSKDVKVNPLPNVNFGVPEICLIDPFAQFTDSSTIADGSQAQFTYLWNFGDPFANAANPNTSTLKNPVHKYSQTGNYTVGLTVTSVDGCAVTLTKPFTVNGSFPRANFDIQNPAGLCSNTEVEIKDISTVDFGNVTKVEIYWDWLNDPTNKTVDDFPNSGTKVYKHLYPDFGAPATKNYTIKLVAYSGGICQRDTNQVITLKASPSVAFNLVPDRCLEHPASAITQAGEIFGFTGVGVFSGPGTSSGGIFSPAAAGVGTHIIRYTFTANNGCTAFREQTVTVNPTPTANAGADRVVLEGGSVTLNGSGTGNGLLYLWTPSAGLSNAQAATPAAAPVNDITYTLTVTTDKGCKASDDVFVKVLKQPQVPNVFTPNGDGVNDRWDIKYLESYPGATVEVFNRYGQAVYFSTGYGTPWNGDYKGKPLPVGTYYYIINPKNGRTPVNGWVTIVR